MGKGDVVVSSPSSSSSPIPTSPHSPGGYCGVSVPNNPPTVNVETEESQFMSSSLPKVTSNITVTNIDNISIIPATSTYRGTPKSKSPNSPLRDIRAMNSTSLAFKSPRSGDPKSFSFRAGNLKLLQLS